jgi:hypothetical protein
MRVVVAVAMVDDGVSQLDAGATVYETNYVGTSCCIRTTDEIMSSFVGCFWSTVQQLFPLDLFWMRDVLGRACFLG